MIISNSKNFTDFNKPSFKSLYYQHNQYNDVYGVKRDTQNSTGKRGDLSYQRLAKILNTRFKDFDKVNMMFMNVSDATEAYFTAQALAEEVGLEEFEKKYAPFRCSDVCEDVIETYPKRGIVHLFKGESEELQINNKLMFKEINKNKYNDLFEGGIGLSLYKLKPEYKKYFVFWTEDFQQRLSDFHDKGNSVVAIRNCFRQSFGDTKSAAIVRNLAFRLKDASLFITGEYDRGMTLFESALDDNFVEIARNVWAKRDLEEPRNYGAEISEMFGKTHNCQNDRPVFSNYLSKLIKKL